MKRIILTTLVCAIAFCSYAQSDSAAMMQAWMKFMTPAEQHKMMAKWDGSWNEDMTVWMAPGAPASKMTAQCQNKTILNGLFQESRHTGNFDGMPFEGIGTVGYDNGRKLWVSTWIDNMGSGMMQMEGKWDEATKSLVMRGTQTDPMSGKSIPVRENYKIVDDNTHLMEMYETKNGKERKMMEIKFTRK